MAESVCITLEWLLFQFWTTRGVDGSVGVVFLGVTCSRVTLNQTFKPVQKHLKVRQWTGQRLMVWHNNSSRHSLSRLSWDLEIDKFHPNTHNRLPPSVTPTQHPSVWIPIAGFRNLNRRTFFNRVAASYSCLSRWAGGYRSKITTVLLLTFRFKSMYN